MNRLIYRPLPGRGRSSNFVTVARCRLWLAPDHLLSVANRGYTEDYKRFYLKDIQSITLRQTRRGSIISILLAGVALSFALSALYGWLLDWDPVGVWVLAGPSAFFFFALLFNAALGPTCVCTLRTAVQSERLQALPRARTALRAIRLIRESVEAAQGALSPEAIDTDNAAVQSAGIVTAVRSHEAVPLLAKGTKPYRGWAHAALFSLLLLDACHSAVQFAWQSIIMYGISLGLLFGLLSSIVLSLIRQADTDLDEGIKKATWWAMGYVMVTYVLNTALFYVYLGVSGKSAPRTTTDTWELMQSMWMTPPLESPVVLVGVLFSLVGSGALGALGWGQLCAFRRRRRQPPSPADAPPLPSV